jgi:hypothetical protein
MKTVGMNFGANADGAGKAIKSFFGKAKKVVKKATTVVDEAIDKAVKNDNEGAGPHIEIVETIHSETSIPQQEVHEETVLPDEGENTGWFNVDS